MCTSVSNVITGVACFAGCLSWARLLAGLLRTDCSSLQKMCTWFHSGDCVVVNLAPTQLFLQAHITERIYKHWASSLLTSMDPKKAIPWDVLCHCLLILGIPSALVWLIASFHTRMCVHVQAAVAHTEHIAIQNVHCQRCTICPVFFNLFFAGVVDECYLIMPTTCPKAGHTFTPTSMDACLIDKLSKVKLLPPHQTSSSQMMQC